MLDSLKSKKDYVFDEMVKSGWDDREFLTEEEVMERWKMDDPKVMRNFYSGRNIRGRKLPVIKFGQRTRRYRPSDVLEFEFEVIER